MADASGFGTTDTDGRPKLCRFCGKAIWWHLSERRFYDAGGEAPHVPGCERALAHYRGEGFLRGQARRDARR